MDEIEGLFPLNKGISVQSECPIGLIGDDIEAVSKKAAANINKPVVPVRCEGFRGVSQSLGHHIANDSIRDWVLGRRDGQAFESTPYDVTIIGDYNIGGDAWSSRILLEEMGLRVIAQWSGDGTLAEMENTPKAKLNLLHCYRSMNYISRHMEEKYRIPWMEYNFFGPTKIAESLRKIAAFFDDSIKAKAEEVDARAFTVKMAERLGLPVTEGKLAAFTVADLKAMLSGEETVEPDVDMASIKLAVRYLWGQSDDAEDLPAIDSHAEGDMPGSLRVAIASNSGDHLDDHFGSAPRFLFYQAGKEAIRLVDIRPTLIADEAEDKNVARAEMINDCQIVYVQSIGGPAAAKVVRAGIHLVKIPGSAPARETLTRLQAVLDAPPPWLARIMGVEARSLARFAAEEEA